jgi:diguanylate cyclase (GGDEF)-like protein
MKWDVFISHAFEDKKYARELANSLVNKGLKVWFDEFELKIGDSLSRSIDRGLSESAYGVVVLSQNFFAKEWTQKELGALISRETKDEKVILPIWHDINHQEVSKYSPMLADRLAILSGEDINKTVEILYSLIKGDPKEKARSYLEIDLEFTKKLARNKQVELDAVIEQAQIVASTDPLTWIKNRRAIFRELQDEVVKSDRNEILLSILMLDLDNFKHINDSHGHLVGDGVLHLVAQRLQNSVASPNIVGRYGGDEFLVVMPNSSIENAVKQAELICEQMRLTPIDYENYQFNISTSIGVAQHRPQQEDWNEFLNRADKALYQAKNNGGNQLAILED